MSNTLVKLILKYINPLKLIPYLLKASGDGTFGPVLKKIYWLRAGKKGFIVAVVTAIGAFFTTLTTEAPADCAAINCSVLYQYFLEWAPVIIAALGVSSIDDGVRADPPIENK
jgi:hypothetical protein